jgi:hypothetical protein
MTSDNIERNARASKTLGVIGLIASIWIALGVAYAVSESDDRIAKLREESLLLVLLVIVAFSTFRNFQIAGSLRTKR